MRCLCIIGLLSTLIRPAFTSGQEIVSAQSGVVHYLEGVAQIDGTPLEHKSAFFPLLKEGSVLATQKGRVELMLTPGVFIRLDENSSLKMLSSALTATRLQFLSGSCIVDAVAAEHEIPVVITFKDASIRFAKAGLYRIDTETEVLQAYSGQAKVEQQDKKTQIDASRLYFFELGTDTNKFSEGTDDEFLDWARNRNQVIAEENQLAQADAGDEEAADVDLGLGLGGLSSLLPPIYNRNYSVPPPVTTFPRFSNVSPYSGLLYNQYAPTSMFPLPPLPGPVLLLGRGYYSHRVGTTRTPLTSPWTVHQSPAFPLTHPIGTFSHGIGTFPRPGVTNIGAPRPGFSHPSPTPHVAGPAAHPVGIGHH
jgi:hypothetical protein